MKKVAIIIMILALSLNLVYSFTGYGESNTFSITHETLPVVLSSFSASITSNNYVLLEWVTQSETNMRGFKVFRNSTNQLETAIQVSGLIASTNTTIQHRYSFLDREIEESGQYYYWLNSIDLGGTENMHGPISLNLVLDDDNFGVPVNPLDTKIVDIVPNPFNPNAMLIYQLDSPQTVKFDVFNIRGQVVLTFTKTQPFAGCYSLQLNGKDKDGKSLSSGIYYIVMTAGKTTSSRKVVVLK